MTEQEQALAFIQRWQGVTASELATSQSFAIALCELLGVERPHPGPEQRYEFERPITFRHGDGSSSPGRIDLYRAGCFVWESKKLRAGQSTRVFDEALLRARSQAESYARALPATEGRPPFLVVVDVGSVHRAVRRVHAQRRHLHPVPRPAQPPHPAGAAGRPRHPQAPESPVDRPAGLDPSRASARVTREVAAELAELAKSLEADGHTPHHVAGFLTRCLFSMFAEDVGLLPKSGPEGLGSFVHLLRQHREQPATLAQMLKIFWAGMDAGGFNAGHRRRRAALQRQAVQGRGGGRLRAAAHHRADRRPAARRPRQLARGGAGHLRHPAGARARPRRAPRPGRPLHAARLRGAPGAAHRGGAAARRLGQRTGRRHRAGARGRRLDGKKREAKLDEARAEMPRFHHQLCTVRVLDPACGSGNFLYVTLEHLKRLEGEVMNQLEALGQTQERLGLEGETVTLQQLRGIELNPRAAALAELVLWIGWLQWHVRTRGLASVAEPVVHDYGNIEMPRRRAGLRPCRAGHGCRRARSSPAGTAPPSRSTR
jgi:hypothetical protein